MLSLMGMSRQSMWLKCSECDILKNGVCEMEAHMKIEHLNWMPFKCPLCGCQRALNSQMKEHLHSSHRNNQTSFQFEDDSEASCRLQEMMEETIRSTLMPKSEMKKEEEANGDFTSASGERIEVENQIETGLPPVTTPVDEDNTLNRKRPHTTESSGATPSSSYSVKEIGAVDGILMNGPSKEETGEGALKKVKMEEPEEEEGGEEEKKEDIEQININPALAAFLSGMGGIFNGMEPNEGEIEVVGQTKEIKVKRSRSTVLYCTKCNKRVKSNEKGAHVSFHLSKDFQMNRFQCKVEGCTQESHRKVNIVNHQMKMHGVMVADPSLINDRQQEMAGLYQTQLEVLFDSNEPEEAGGDSTLQSLKDAV